MAQPWERIAWSDEFVQEMYRDWGTSFTQKNLLDVAIDYYNKSLNIRGEGSLSAEDARALYLRGQCNMQLAQTQIALEDTDLAEELLPRDVNIDHQQCRALYELNRLEDAKVLMHDNTRKYVGVKVALFKNDIIVLDENFNDSLGEAFGPFILKAEKHLKKVLSTIERINHAEKRPLWKILRSEGKCDVLSILEKEEELLSPREIARRERAYRVFNQIYLLKSWEDVKFLRDMRTDPNLLWPSSKESGPFLRQLTKNKYKAVKKFEKMLHARSPLYNEMMVKFGNKNLWEKNKEDYLNRVQYQTRRNMISVLRTIKKLRESKEIGKLAKYVEEVMGDYVVLKTNRVMPWKFEFVNEVYNTLALAFADRYKKIPEIPEFLDEENRILAILHLPTEYKEKPAFVFGVKSTYQEPDGIDRGFIAYKNLLARLEKRIIFAKYPIEKCYLYHEIARAHLKQNHYDECCSSARKAFEEVKNFDNHLWAFLSAMLIVKANAMVRKIENCSDALGDALEQATSVNSLELVAFVERCQDYNDSDIKARKNERSFDVGRKRKSRSNSAMSSSISGARSMSRQSSFSMASVLARLRHRSDSDETEITLPPPTISFNEKVK